MLSKAQPAQHAALIDVSDYVRRGPTHSNRL